MESSDPPEQRVSRARYLRERAARESAERLLESKSRELYDANLKLEAEAKRLDAAVAARTEELKTALARAEAGTLAKAQFLATMSHEIRTPLNGVLGMAQSLLSDALSPAQRDKVTIIVESGASLTALLNDVLDISKIEAGKLEIAPVPGDLLHTVSRTLQLFDAQAEEKGLTLRLRHDPAFPTRLGYDPVRVRQCVSNLVSNAIKFTSHGAVEAHVSASVGPQGGWLVSIAISDTGIGMSADTQARLFEVFTQADGAITRKFGGTGLGLAISRQLARMMGGDIIVRSEDGRGSTFCLTFAAAEVEALAPAEGEQVGSRSMPEPTGQQLRGIRLLLTDDNAINRQVIKLFLAPQGMEIVEASHGQEALDLLASQRFDIVLLDIHMPVMDGRETIRRIRKSEESWQSTPVIALTADAMAGDREKFIAMGMSDYISKPVDQRELVSKIAKFTARNAVPLAAVI